MKLIKILTLALFLLILLSHAATPIQAQPNGSGAAQRVDYKVGFLGVPSHPQVDWNAANLQRMKNLGFNVLQLNIAWGYRPNDEPLNLEDVIDLPPEMSLTLGDQNRKEARTRERIAVRSEKLRQRIEISRQLGFRTLFHFGAPNVFYPPESPGGTDALLDQCIADEATVARYVTLIQAFHAKFPGVDDLLCYTYDQNAWLCSEAGACPRCHGVPLSERVSKFINTLARTWRELHPKGTLYWEPWELSAGQTYHSVDLLDASCVGLSLHSSIAEVQIALPADRWFRNMLTKAEERNIPVIGELWTGSPTEEMEPYLHIATPLATLRALRAVNNAGKLTGIKEYYGNVPDKEDPNLRMTGIFFNNPDISDESALATLAQPYNEAAQGVSAYWKLSSEAIEMYPWDVSWRAREVGRSNPRHPTTAAVLKGASWQTPEWQSNRRTAFLRTDQTDSPNFWMREDIQLRFEQSASKLQAAIAAAQSVQGKIPDAYKATFDKSVEELAGLKTRVLSYAYHLRESNLADLIRDAAKQGLKVNERNVLELRSLLVQDQKNMGTEEPMGSAITTLDNDLDQFLKTYFLPSAPSGKNDNWDSPGFWSITSQ